MSALRVAGLAGGNWGGTGLYPGTAAFRCCTVDAAPSATVLPAFRLRVASRRLKFLLPVIVAVCMKEARTRPLLQQPV